MAEVRKEVRLSKEVVKLLGTKAKAEKRSLKNYMENILIKEAEKK